MILSNLIQIPVLCSLQFSEPKEINMYNRQMIYTPKLVTSQGNLDVFILIDQSIYESESLEITLQSVEYNGDINSQDIISNYNFTKYQLSSGYYYAVARITDLADYENKCVLFNIVDNDSEKYAYSVPYVINPDYIDDLKIIKYTNSENDWNIIFSSSLYYSIAVECGFIPRDFRGEQETEDYLDQSLTNETIYGNNYEVNPLTIGDNGGVPNWLAYKMMCATLCDTFKIDDIQYKRVNGSKFEKVEDTENGLAIYKVDLQTENTYLQ